MSHVRSRRRGQIHDDDYSEGEETESIAEQSSDAADSSDGQDSSSDDDSEDGESISGSDSEDDEETESVQNDTPAVQKNKEPVKAETSEALSDREKQILERREYRRKLAEDPSFVPYVGQFWSHDDRYRDDALRPARDQQPESSTKPERRQQPQQNKNYRRVPDGLINQKWSHDGYEWLLRMDEEDKQRRNNPRRPPRYQQQQQRRRRPSKDGANSNWQSFDPSQEQSSWPKLKDTSKDKVVSDISNDDWAKKATWNEQPNTNDTTNINGNGWGDHKVEPESKSEGGWGSVDAVEADTVWGTAPTDVAKKSTTSWGSSTPAGTPKDEGSAKAEKEPDSSATTATVKEDWRSIPVADTSKASEGWGDAPVADTSKDSEGWGAAPATNTSKTDEGWGAAPAADTFKTDEGWGGGPVADTSKASEGWGDAPATNISKTDEGWGAAPAADTSKTDEGWGAAPSTNTSTKDGWGSIDAPKVDAGWGSTDENATKNANNWETNVVSDGNERKKTASWTNTKTEAAKKDPPKDEQASAGWSSWNANRSQRRGRGYLSQKKPIEAKAPEPAVYGFDTLQSAPWETSGETDAWSHKKFIEQDDKEDQESDVEIILEAEPDWNKSKVVEEQQPERRMDENWRRRDDVPMQPQPQQQYFYPQPMGNYAPMTPHAYGIPLQPMPSSTAEGNEEQQYAMPPAFEANGMVYYGVDPSAMYNYYYYQQMPVMVPQQGGEESDGWGHNPQYAEEPTDPSQPPPAGYQYYYPPSYYT
ncbi:hypothetical protein BJV82DRAFT_578041 [Fennellomyces sp. T-0311]|nr:hypothetical protein BJV82DRAFT_578041 [Fennellomyces sp. T-0311]